MGMASSDDEKAIMEEHCLMERIKSLTPEYGHVTCNMNEDMRAIYDHDLKSKFLGTGSYAPKVEVSYAAQAIPYETRATKGPSNYPVYKTPEDEDDKKIASLKKKIEIARLELELAELEEKKKK